MATFYEGGFQYREPEQRTPDIPYLRESNPEAVDRFAKEIVREQDGSGPEWAGGFVEPKFEPFMDANDQKAAIAAYYLVKNDYLRSVVDEMSSSQVYRGDYDVPTKEQAAARTGWENVPTIGGGPRDVSSVRRPTTSGGSSDRGDGGSVTGGTAPSSGGASVSAFADTGFRPPPPPNRGIGPPTEAGQYPAMASAPSRPGLAMGRPLSEPPTAAAGDPTLGGRRMGGDMGPLSMSFENGWGSPAVSINADYFRNPDSEVAQYRSNPGPMIDRGGYTAPANYISPFDPNTQGMPDISGPPTLSPNYVPYNPQGPAVGAGNSGWASPPSLGEGVAGSMVPQDGITIRGGPGLTPTITAEGVYFDPILGIWKAATPASQTVLGR